MIQITDLGPEFEGNLSITEFRDNRRLHCPSAQIYQLLQTLKENFGFEYLVDITAVDYLDWSGARDRFGIVYCLLNTNTGERIIIKTFVNDPDVSISSSCGLWKGANWMEREVFDMFGITFLGHPDLRRILSPDDFHSFPLRKDYPLQGHGERHNFPVLTRADS